MWYTQSGTIPDMAMGSNINQMVFVYWHWFFQIMIGIFPLGVQIATVVLSCPHLDIILKYPDISHSSFITSLFHYSYADIIGIHWIFHDISA